jgi:single-strand DNA-binding protein
MGASPMNHMTMIGNLGKEPELRYTNDSLAICSFTIGVSESKKSDEPLWMDVTCFGELAENCAASLSKGSRVVVIGRFRRRKYEKKDGTTGYATELVADDVAANLRFATVTIEKGSRAPKGNSGGHNEPEEPF